LGRHFNLLTLSFVSFILIKCNQKEEINKLKRFLTKKRNPNSDYYLIFASYFDKKEIFIFIINIIH